VANGRLLRAWNLEEHTEGGLRVAFNPNGKLLATSNRNGQTRLWDACRGKLLHILDKVSVHDVKFHPDGTLLAVAYVNGAVGLWNVANGELITLLDGHALEVYNVAWSPKGEILAWCGTNGTIVLWSAVSKAVLRTLDAAPSVHDLEFSPDGRFLLSGGSVVRIWGIPK
jgi:WD40 repeat protein